MSIDPKIKQECIRRGITRICHFTPSRNLAHIIAGKIGVLATEHLEKSERQVFNATDLKRYDGHKGHICCSVEYPNVWYLSRKIEDEKLFKDWVILLIKPYYLWKKDTLYCHRNASAGCGCYINGGFESFKLLYQDVINGSGGRTYKRSNTHLIACPTDNQAEVLVPDCISLPDITGIVIRDRKQARNEISRLKLQELKLLVNFYVVPEFYDKHAMSHAISKGVRPKEILFNDGDRHD